MWAACMHGLMMLMKMEEGALAIAPARVEKRK